MTNPPAHTSHEAYNAWLHKLASDYTHGWLWQGSPGSWRTARRPTPRCEVCDFGDGTETAGVEDISLTVCKKCLDHLSAPCPSPRFRMSAETVSWLLVSVQCAIIVILLASR